MRSACKGSVPTINRRFVSILLELDRRGENLGSLGAHGLVLAIPEVATVEHVWHCLRRWRVVLHELQQFRHQHERVRFNVSE
jgi:hypothetical protein